MARSIGRFCVTVVRLLLADELISQLFPTTAVIIKAEINTLETKGGVQSVEGTIAKKRKVELLSVFGIST